MNRSRIPFLALAALLALPVAGIAVVTAVHSAAYAAPPHAIAAQADDDAETNDDAAGVKNAK